jgi:hypothetical protein
MQMQESLLGTFQLHMLCYKRICKKKPPIFCPSLNSSSICILHQGLAASHHDGSGKRRRALHARLEASAEKPSVSFGTRARQPIIPPPKTNKRHWRQNRNLTSAENEPHTTFFPT